MKTFFVENFGCRATEADAAALRRELLGRGFESTGEWAAADIVVLNTCTVTAAADAGAREAIRKIHRLHPGKRIIVTGCYAQRAPEELAALDGVTSVVGNSHQSDIPRLVADGLLTESNPPAGAPAGKRVSGEAARGPAGEVVPTEQLDGDAPSLKRRPAKILAGDIVAWADVEIAPADLSSAQRTRPILKIQDGCNYRCAYCVIPLVRGRSRSLPPDAVVAEARQLCAAGAKEIVLSGINLGSYGRELTPRATLVEVVERLLEETAVEQMRFSSIEPEDVTEDFVSLVAGSDRLARHFHVPLQSGSDRILRAMHRWYRAEHYAQRLRLIRRRLPDAAIGADVIVGFPGESDRDFRDTCDFIAQLPFTYLHVFSFSPRPGTAAEHARETVPGPVIRERARALRALSGEKCADFRKQQAGRVLRALTLDRHTGGSTEALTGNYLKVAIPGLHPANQWHAVTIRADLAARCGPGSVNSQK